MGFSIMNGATIRWFSQICIMWIPIEGFKLFPKFTMALLFYLKNCVFLRNFYPKLNFSDFLYANMCYAFRSEKVFQANSWKSAQQWRHFYWKIPLSGLILQVIYFNPVSHWHVIFLFLWSIGQGNHFDIWHLPEIAGYFDYLPCKSNLV